MLKRTLIAIAAVALLVGTAQGALEIYDTWDHDSDPNTAEVPTPMKWGNHSAVKVDGSQTVRWPFEYTALEICRIPVLMKIGMFVKVTDCKKKKIVLEQVDCGDLGLGAGDFPCYFDCETIAVAANFDVKIGVKLYKIGTVLNKTSAYVDGSDVVPGDGNNHNVSVCVKAWQTQIQKGAVGDTTKVGELSITAKPDV